MPYGETSLSKYIQRQFLSGYGKSEIFERICRNSGLERLDHTEDIFLAFETGKTLGGYNLTSQHCALARLIWNELQLLKRGVEARSCGAYIYCKLKMINNRYAIDNKCRTGREFMYFVLVDTFYGQTRRIRCEQSFDLPEEPEIFPINEKYFIAAVHDWCGSCDIYYLLQLDIPNLTCKLLDHTTVDGRCCTLIFDSKCRENFLICLEYYDETQHFKRGRVENGKFKMEEQIFDNKFYLIVRSLKLEGDTAYGLVRGNDRAKFYAFKKLTFDQTSVKATKFCRIKQIDNLYINNECMNKFAWFQQKCYALFDFNDTLQFLELDLENETARKINIKKCGIFKDLYSDDSSGFLTAAFVGGYHGQHVTKRFALKQPDKLKTLAVHAVQKRAMFMEKMEYERFIQTLPSGLRPFQGNLC